MCSFTCSLGHCVKFSLHLEKTSCIEYFFLKAKHLHISGSAFYLVRVGLSEHALGWCPLSSRLVVKDEPSELCVCRGFFRKQIFCPY